MVRPLIVAPSTRSKVPLPVRDALASSAMRDSGVRRAVASIRDGLRGLLASANSDADRIGNSADARAEGLDETLPRNARSRSVPLTRTGPRVTPAASTYCPTNVVESGADVVSVPPSEAVKLLDWRGERRKPVAAAVTCTQRPR